MQKSSRGLQLKDIIMVGVASIVFGIIYLGAVHLGIFLGTLLTPFGLAVLANEFIFGIWFMAASFAMYIIQKPSVAVITEIIAAFLEVFMGNIYGPIVFISGFVQGIGTEAGFAVYRYKKFGWTQLLLGATFATLSSFIWGMVRSNFMGLSWSLILSILIIRWLSAVLFSAVLVKLICDKLSQSGVLNQYQLGHLNK